MACAVAAAIGAAATCRAQAQAAGSEARCGELVTIQTYGTTTTRYALALPPAAAEQKPPVALLLLPGGGGDLDLDPNGCPRSLRGNFLVRSLAHFHAAGFITALVDARSDHRGDEGLAGLRTHAEHATDLGKVIADVRARTGAAIWVVGTSRGTISAANAAARLAGSAAPDGLVLTSTLTYGSRSKQWPWTTQSVFDLPLDAIRIPTLIVGHANDGCMRTPASQMDRIAGRIPAAPKQVVTVTGGSGIAAAPGIDACEGRTPHGFLEQEAEVIAGIARFVRGGRY